MRIFVTGASGFVGSAVVSELLKSGHGVLGLARSEKSAAAIEAAGAEVLRGALTDLAVLQAGVRDCDGVVHTGFNHDFARFAASCAEDRAAIEAMGDALQGSDRPLLVTSGIVVRAAGPVSVETDPGLETSDHYPRASEPAATSLAGRGVNARTVRLPFSVHGPGDHGFVPMLIAIARQKGYAAYVGDGANRWPAVHRLDAAKVYRRALEEGAAPGPFHAVGEEGVAFREIAAAIGAGLGLPVRSVPAEDARDYFGFLAAFVGLNAPASTARTAGLLGWAPKEATLLEDIAGAGYFSG